MSMVINEGVAKADLEKTASTSAFTRVSQQSVGVIPITTSLNNRDEITPTPASSTGSESPPTLRRPPFEADEADDDDADTDANADAFAWPTHNSYDEQRQLLGTEEESSDHATSEEEELMMEDYKSSPKLLSSSAASNSAGKRSVWSITREQINYYTTQFFCLQSDPHGVIPGAEAKEFFERSKLPINDLRKIWQLSDVSQDGCLSLEEFLTAMHLVVLKRNDIDLPESLPPVLRPTYLRQRLSKANKKVVLKPTLPNHHNKDLYVNDDPETASNADERLLSNDDEADAKSSKTDKNNDSVVSSPGRPQPVNFDFRGQDALRRDPTIVQPVAVRLSPDSPVLQSSDLDEDEEPIMRRKMSRGEVGYEKLWNAGIVDDPDEDDEEGDIAPEAGPVSLPASRLKIEASPPPPPPRGSSTSTTIRPGHARSSSLDLNNLSGGLRPPLPPPRVPGSSGRGSGRDCRALHCKIQEYREKNSVVARTINELHQEVSDALEERIALEYQLEQLKSFGDE